MQDNSTQNATETQTQTTLIIEKPGNLKEWESPDARERLAKLEAIIEKGKATFLQVGRACHEIKENKLYRTLGFKDFFQYLRLDTESLANVPTNSAMRLG